MKNSLIIFSIAFIIVSLLCFNYANNLIYSMPSANNANFKINEVVSGFTEPTGMHFVDSNTILVLEKSGNVRIVSNNVLQNSPVLTVDAVNKNERGLLGMAADNDYVFLYFTTKLQKDGNNELRNVIYRYEFDGTKLIDPLLLADVPATPGTNHQGGKIFIGKDGTLYSITGEMQRNGQLQNIKNGPPPDSTGIILRIDPTTGQALPDNPFVNKNPNVEGLDRYYAYGIRNSFGLTFDPITGDVWDSENGPKLYDEINHVNPGFNSGWKLIMGPISKGSVSEDELVNYNGAKYSDPEFSWLDPVGITDIEFFHSDKFGQQYKDNLFAGDINNGNLYLFQLNQNRDGFLFTPDQKALTDLVADNDNESDLLVFAKGFGGITDIETGPDGYLYVLTFDDGKIFKITP